MKSIKSIFASNFSKSVLIIAGSTAFAQLLNALLYPVVTRIYSPEEYGVLAVYIAILDMLVIAGSLKYELGVVIAENDKKAVNTLALSVIVLLAVTLLITLILIFFGNPFLGLFNGEVLINYWPLIPLGIFFAGLCNIFIQWAFRKKDFKSISKTKLSQAIAQNITRIGLGLLNLGPIGLIISSSLGQSTGITTLSIAMVKREKGILKKISLGEIFWCARRYIRFPLLSASSEFLNTAGIQLPVLFITSLYESEVIGFYALANCIASLPMSLIGASVGDVFYGEAASIGRSEPKRLKELSQKLLKKLIIIGIVPLVILFLLGPFLFSLVFGDEWYEAGVYARIISFLVFTRLIFTPISRVYTIFERQKEAFILDCFRVILVITVFGISKLISINSYWAIGLYALVLSVVYFLTFIWAQKIINDEIKKNEYETSLL